MIFDILLTLLIFFIVVYLFLYWATSSTFIGCQGTKNNFDNLLEMLNNLSEDIKKIFKR